MRISLIELDLKFGVFYEHQLPRPWTETSELDLLQESLDQVELGMGEGGGPAELHPFGVQVRSKRDRWIEAVKAIIPMFSRTTWEFHGEFYDFPARNVLPKPIQKPHPPLWVACTNVKTIAQAAEWGMGALGFSFALSYYGRKGIDAPGTGNLWGAYQEWRRTDKAREALATGLIGSPETIRKRLRQYEAAHVDQVILLNQAGKTTHVANARPDGHTLFIGTNSTHGANPALQRQMTYDPIGNFAPITRIAVFSSVIVVHPKVPVADMKQLIAYGKENELTLATGNASGVVMGETLARAVGWKVLRVPYKSNPQAMQDLVAGRVSMMFSDIASSLGQINAGALRPVAITSRARSASHCASGR